MFRSGRRKYIQTPLGERRRRDSDETSIGKTNILKMTYSVIYVLNYHIMKYYKNPYWLVQEKSRNRKKVGTVLNNIRFNA